MSPPCPPRRTPVTRRVRSAALTAAVLAAALSARGAAFLKRLQFEDDAKDVKYGGVGYNKGDRPDLSNTQYFIDAMLAAGVPRDDPALQRALKFVSRCQNLPGETNDQPWAKKTTED